MSKTKIISITAAAVLFFVSNSIASGDKLGDITNMMSNKCIDVEGTLAVNNGSKVQLHACDSAASDSAASDTDQKWEINSEGFIINKFSKRCLDVVGAPGTGNSAKLQLWDCEFENPNTDQKWEINNEGFIINKLSKKCIDVVGDPGIGNGAKLQLWDCQFTRPSTDQKWFIDNKVTDKEQSSIKSGSLIFSQKWKYIGGTSSGEHSVKYSTGLTEGEGVTKGSSEAEEITKAIEASLTVGAEYGAGSVETNITAKYEDKRTKTTSKEISKYFEKQVAKDDTTSCKYGAVWQWSYSIKDSENSIGDMENRTKKFACTTVDDKPTQEQRKDPSWKGCAREKDPERPGEWRCKKSGDEKKTADQPGKASKSGTGAAKADAGFKKDGNNGTISCNTYCGKVKADGTPEWGAKTGVCVDAKNESTGKNVSCDTVPGLIQDGKQLTCYCDDRFTKGGNNGTVSCDTYCGKVKADGTPEWGDKTGACVEAKNESTGQSVSCDTVPGLIQDGKQLTCTCR